MKKILTLVLAVVLVMGLATTAFAESPIEETNGTDSKNVTATYEEVTEETIYRVDIKWGSLLFKYTEASEGTWDPENHKYNNPVAYNWSCEENANEITVSNHSNAEVNIGLAYNKTVDAISGSFGENGTLTIISAVGTTFEQAPSASAFLTLDGAWTKPAGTDPVTVGSVTVTLN